jgi:hypothetical protein
MEDVTNAGPKLYKRLYSFASDRTDDRWFL